MTFSDKVIQFNKNLSLSEALPEDIRVMNPFVESPQVLETSSAFYRKYYRDHHSRKLILGINPGRLGAGATGIPFTDPKRLKEKCGLTSDLYLHEPSSVFIYEVVEAYGGVGKFYRDFYISSVCPLGFVKKKENGSEINFNYYDNPALAEAVTPFIIKSIKAQISLGVNTEKVFCLGTGKNYKYLKSLNKKYQFFEQIIALEHPRYIMQYKSRTKDRYIDKYLCELCK